MEEINPVTIREDTKPSYETDVAKWYLLKNGDKFAVWRWDSKKDPTDKTFLITHKETNKIMGDSKQLESVLYRATALEKAYEEEKE